MTDLSGIVDAGSLVVMDPSDKRVLTLSWDDELPQGVLIRSSVYTITVIRQSGTALTKDSESIVAGSRATRVRLLATTATAGDRYRIDNQIVTEETPVQVVERSFMVKVEHR